MVLFSTNASIESGRISFLAIIETILAVSLAVCLIKWTGSMTFLFIGAITTPLFLLRTDRSVSYGLKMFNKIAYMRDPEIIGTICAGIGIFIIIITAIVLFFRSSAIIVLKVLGFFDLYKTPSWASFDDYFEFSQSIGVVGVKYFLLIMIFILLIGIIPSILIRAVAVFKSFLEAPIETLAAVPNNWFKYTWCYDFVSIPEIFPGISKNTDLKERFEFSKFLAINFQLVGISLLVGFLTSLATFLIAIACSVLLFFSLIFLVYIPSFFLRISIKATSLFYLPLLYLAKVTFVNLRAPELFERVKNDSVSIYFAWFTIISHILVPLGFLMLYGSLEYHNYTSQFAADLIQYFAFYPVLGLLPISKIINALTTITTYKFSIIAARRNWGSKAELSIRISYLLRAFLTIYSVIFVLLIVYYYTEIDQVKYVFNYVKDTVLNIDINWNLLPKKPTKLSFSL